jgi:hypothetical protein
MSDAPDIEKSDEHFIHLWFRNEGFLWTVYVTQKHLTFYSFSPISLEEHSTNDACIQSKFRTKFNVDS